MCSLRSNSCNTQESNGRFLVVSSLSRLEETARHYQPSHMISLINMGVDIKRPATVSAQNHLYLNFNDINTPISGLVSPEMDHMEQLLAHARKWYAQCEIKAPLLIHCAMGISRSTAAAYCIAAALNPNRDEYELAQTLRHTAPSATPNIRLITLADDLLIRQGRMVEAIQMIGRGRDAFEGTPFKLELNN